MLEAISNIDTHHIILISFGISAVICWLVLVTKQLHSDFTTGQDAGPQTVHAGTVPRIGGVGIFLALFVTWLIAKAELSAFSAVILFSSISVFAAGILEDITGKISPKLRLFFSLLTGLTFVLLADVTISTVSIPLIDPLLQWWPLSVFLTILAIASVSNAINVIDGLNGLSIGSCSFMGLSVGYLAFMQGDIVLAGFAFLYVTALAGVGVFNFPFGKIFVGDGGAYLMGAVIAMLAILLPERNTEISPFASLLIIIYPFYELLRSLARRLLLGRNALLPDSKHLHSVMYRGNLMVIGRDRIVRNYVTTLMVLPLPAFCSLWAGLFSGSTIFLCAGLFIFAMSYEVLTRIYRRQP